MARGSPRAVAAAALIISTCLVALAGAAAADPVTPDPPVLVELVPGPGTLDVHWAPPPHDGGAPVDAYEVVVSHRGGEGDRERLVGAGQRAARFTGLTPESTYAVWVRARNAVGMGPPSPVGQAFVFAANGYWMLDEVGVVYEFGDAPNHGYALFTGMVDIESTPAGDGYWTVDRWGFVSSFGAARNAGGLNGAVLPGESVEAIAPHGSTGYWLVTTSGRVSAHGTAPFLGDLAGVPLNAPVIDAAVAPGGGGYALAGADGGVFTFGGAAFAGSAGGLPLASPVRSVVADPDGVGYWLVAGDGGVFAFDAPFHGSMGGTPLNRPVVGMVGSTAGYLLVAEDGGAFAFGAAPFRGSLGAAPPSDRVVAVARYR